jgi:hypothetical protein
MPATQSSGLGVSDQLKNKLKISLRHSPTETISSLISGQVATPPRLPSRQKNNAARLTLPRRVDVFSQED